MDVKSKVRMFCMRCAEVTEQPAAGALFLEGCQVPVPAVFCEECHECLIEEWGVEAGGVGLVQGSDGVSYFVPAGVTRGFIQ